MLPQSYWQQIVPRAQAEQELRSSDGFYLVSWEPSLWTLYMPGGHYWNELNDGHEHRASEAVRWASEEIKKYQNL